MLLLLLLPLLLLLLLLCAFAAGLCLSLQQAHGAGCALPCNSSSMSKAVLRANDLLFIQRSFDITAEHQQQQQQAGVPGPAAA
jgi:hypothetical protein